MATLIVTPLSAEFEAVVATFENGGHTAEATKVGRIPVAYFPSLDATVAISGHGKAQSAAQTQYVLQRTAPVDVVVCAGVSGGLRPELKTGDVVVGTEIVEHDFRRRITPGPSPVFVSHAATVARLRAIVASGPWPFGVHFGKVASGDEDVVAVDRASELVATTGAHCVAWEGAGVARTSLLNDLGFLEVRGISDAADARTPAEFRRNVRIATGNVATVLLRWQEAVRRL